MKHTQTNRRGFSLIELVIVVVIIAIIAAIAIPKMSRAAAGANDSATMQDLSQMRSAIDMFAAEHGGTLPSTTITTFGNQLTTYTDINGVTSPTKTGSYIYGPYIKSIPALPVGTYKGSTTVTATGPAGSTAGAGWFYDGATMWVNDPSTDIDTKGVAWNTY